MTITCKPNPARGITTVIGGDIPDGHAILTRLVQGESPYLLRDGSFDVSTGGFTRDDTEAPFGVPLTYRLDLTGYDRVAQRNLMLTPTFLHGIKGWTTGPGRSLTVVPDPTAHSAQVGHVNANTAGSALVPPPVAIGHVDSPNGVSAPYNLLPPTSGPTAIAPGDWVYIFHTQLNALALMPPAPPGFTEVWRGTSTPIDGIVWRRKRLAGDTGYTVAAAAFSTSFGSAIWVRGASDTDPVIVGGTVDVSGSQQVVFPPLTLPRPGLVLTLSAANLYTNAPQPTAADVFGSALMFVQGDGSSPRNNLAATQPNVNAGTVPQTRIMYQGTLLAALGVQLGIQTNQPTPPRQIAVGKAAAMPATDSPYLFTGRFRFNTPDLNIWQTVKTWGTWADVKARGTWADVRGAGVLVGAEFLKLFVSIVDPATGNYYVNPVQVITATSPQLNQWIDFSFLFSAPVDIPATAEIRLMHGTNAREFACEFWLDEFGITPSTRSNTVYWFDGDSTPPANAEDNLMAGGAWDSFLTDADMAWTGTVGNSVSVFYGPSEMYTDTLCQLDGPEDTTGGYCAPVFVNDPVSPGLAQWFSLIGIDSLDYTARQSLYDVINRGPMVAVAQMRSWATGSLTLLTRTLAERSMVIRMFASGRIVLYRNPDPLYPESNWYLAVGNVNEARPIPDGRRPERLWTVPFARVERPSGLIDSAVGTVWQDVKDGYPNWLGVRAGNEDWLQVLTGVPAGVL